MPRLKLKTLISIIVVVLIVILYETSSRTKESIENVQTEKETFSELIPSLNEDRIRIFHLQRIEEIETKTSAAKIKNEENSHPLVPVDFEINSRVSFKDTGTNMQHKLVHIDLKGAPPKLEYLKSLLPMLKTAGATGFLIEYEDMYPYDYELEAIKAVNAYQKIELRAFLEAVRNYDMIVIPLIQTFGHLEFVLKLEQFRDIREADQYPDTICPSKNRSFDVLTHMIDQVIDFHSNTIDTNWIHIGCDEVYHLNRCDICQKRKLTNKEIFSNHVVRISEYIKDKHPKITVLIWDDMLRSFLPTELEASKLGSLVEPMVWVYSPSITALVPHRVWYLYTKIFTGVWVASAFKGASGSTKTIPPLRKYYENNMSWMNFTTNYKTPGINSNYIFKGIVLTGWSRYHHFAVLCETIPVSVPSLILNLLLVSSFFGYFKTNSRSTQSEFEKQLLTRWLSFLQCHNTRRIRFTTFSKKEALRDVERIIHLCSFREHKLYGDMISLVDFENEAIAFHINNAYKNDGMLQYNVKHNAISVYHGRTTLLRALKMKEDLTIITKNLKSHMEEFYDDDTIREFIEYKIYPIEDIFQKVINADAKAKNTSVWKVRPFR